MMKKLMFIFLIAWPIIVNAQTVWMFFAPDVTDVRSAAMGRTSIVSATGSNAIFSNPAIIATLEDKQVQAGGRLFFGTIKDESAEDYFDSYDAKYSPHIKLNHISFSMPYQFPDSKIKMSLGIGYQTYYDLGVKIEEELSYEGYEGEYTYNVSGGLNTITPAVAVNIQDKYFIGATFNKSIFGKITENDEAKSEGSKYEQKLEIEHSGSFLSIGGLARLNPNLTVGFMYRPGFEWEWDEIKYKYYEDGELIYSGKLSGHDWEFPGILGIGVEYKISPKLTLAGELQTRPFSDYELDGLKSGIDDGYCYRLGAEIQNAIPIRLGFFSDAIMATDSGDDSPKSLMGFTGGLGFTFRTINLDASFEYGSWSYEDYYGDEYSENLFRFGVSAQYKF